MIGVDHRNERVFVSDDALDIVGLVVLGDHGERHLEILSDCTNLGDLIDKTAEATLFGVYEDRVVARSDRAAEIKLLVDVADRNDLASEIGKSREAVRSARNSAHLIVGFDRTYLHAVKSITLISCRKNNLLSKHVFLLSLFRVKPSIIMPDVLSGTDQPFERVPDVLSGPGQSFDCVPDVLSGPGQSFDRMPDITLFGNSSLVGRTSLLKPLKIAVYEKIDPAVKDCIRISGFGTCP